MARKRMFDLEVVDTDLFLEMPQSTQNLYFHLGMRADDDGFVSNPKKIVRTINSSEDDLKVLITKQFVIPFESGVIVIRHWKLNNYLRKDRKQDTLYQKEFKQLTEDENGIYNLVSELGIPNDNQMTTNGLHRIEENRIEEYSIDKIKENNKKKTSDEKIHFAEFVSMTNAEHAKLISTYGEDLTDQCIQKLDNYKGSSGKKYKSDYRAILSWVVEQVQKDTKKSKSKVEEVFYGQDRF